MESERAETIAHIRDRLIAIENADGTGTELTPNADELIAISNDLGQKAAAGAADLVDSVLSSVSAFLDSLFSG